jgi:hypothetical protein
LNRFAQVGCESIAFSDLSQRFVLLKTIIEIALPKCQAIASKLSSFIRMLRTFGSETSVMPQFLPLLQANKKRRT